jgi:hypothetical protein
MSQTKGNRQIEVNKNLNIYKQEARENLMSDIGKELRGRRCSEVEQTFGQIKWNKGFKRFLLKGIPKITVEVALIALAHNFQKLNVLLNKKDLNAKILQKILALRSFLKQFRTLSKKNSTIKNQTGNKYQSLSRNEKGRLNYFLDSLVPSHITIRCIRHSDQREESHHSFAIPLVSHLPDAKKVHYFE